MARAKQQSTVEMPFQWVCSSPGKAKLRCRGTGTARSTELIPRPADPGTERTTGLRCSPSNKREAYTMAGEISVDPRQIEWAPGRRPSGEELFVVDGRIQIEGRW